MPIVKYTKGDLLEHDGPIAHGVNWRGKMASGAAKKIRASYPEHYDDCIELCRNVTNLGAVFVSYYKEHYPEYSHVVIGMFTQEKHGYENKTYVDYLAVGKCFKKVNEMFFGKGIVLGIPKIGSGLGGGDWKIIEDIINLNTPDLDVEVYEL
jgi:O-acetyl-ADP-ribose deacetylase (regulator of RNase III)